jgi:FG-GAP-like repeat/Subtilase family
MSVDRAWADYTTGSPGTVIAYVEGGINWHDDSARDLVNKVYLNRGELPVPCAAAPCTTHFSHAFAKYDVNHDGTLNVEDYSGDPRVSDRNGNGYVDPEDLIVVFSDGTDHDHNGYVDDISGWDFYNRQNDPATIDTTYTHANNQMRRAAAEANNSYLGAGVCPKCMILPVKAGAEALDRTDDLAQAWLFAADSGASVIVSVTADLGYSSFMRKAVNRIWRRGVVMVEASNDFDSTDHQGGMFWPHVLPGNGLVADKEGVPNGQASTTTFRARSNYTSWGAHNMFSVASSGGTTSESTPIVGGVAALVMAYGKQAAAQHLISGPLTNAETVQVLRATASDVADPSLPWAGKPGWDLQYGYGRPNVWKAMRAVSTGAIPPVGWIDSPDWYSLYDPTTTAQVPVRGHVEAPRSSGYTWKLEYAPGAEPTDASFITAATGSGTAPYDGVLGNIDLSKVPQSFWNAAFHVSSTKTLETNEQYTVTLRLRVTDASGRKGEERRAIAVHHDPSLVAGFPKRIGSGGEGQPALVDLQGTGRLAIVFGDSDGRVHAIDPKTRHELPGWPARTNPTVVTKSHAGVASGYEPVVSNVAVGDLRHDGRLEVVATSTSGTVYAFSASGTLLAGWPKALDLNVAPPPIPRPSLPFTRLAARGATAPPVLADLNGDGTLEVVQVGWDGYIHVWRANGTVLPGWPVRVTEAALPPVQSGYSRVHDSKLDSPPAVADIDGDHQPDVVVRSQFTDVTGSGITFNASAHMYAYHADGTPVSGWPNSFTTLAEYYGSAQEFITEGSASPVAADVEGDGTTEIAAGGAFGPTYLFDGSGATVTTYGGANDVPVTFTTSGAFGNFGGGLAFAQPGTDGNSLIQALLTPGSGQPIVNLERAYTAAGGALLPGFPAKMQGLDFLGAPLITDVVGDGSTVVVNSADSSALHGFAPGGGQAATWPKFFTGWSLWSPTAGDLTTTGNTDLVMASREGYLFAWSTPGLATANTEWWHADHDERNSGTYGVDARPPGAIRKLVWPGHGTSASFTAPGDDWYAGTVASYSVKFLPAGTTVTVAPSGPAGTNQVVSVPPGTTSFVVQAVDDAGNLGMPRTAT